jgi:DNA-binding NarL/FixJ family response regulator
MAVRILVVDDHPVTREGVRLAVCARHADCIVDISDSIGAAREQLRRGHRYDLVLLDYRLPDSEGLSGFFTLQTVAGSAPIAILTASVSTRLAPIARNAGAVGFISKSQPMDEIARAIDALLAGGTVFPHDGESDPDIIALRDDILSLSPAQLQVLIALLRGSLNKQIGAELNLTEATVKAHMTAIFRKLGVNGRIDAVTAVRPLFSDLDLA